MTNYNKPSPSVCFVVLNWNQPEMTIDCLNSLAEQAYDKFNVILVDNGSQDDSVVQLRDCFPQITLIDLPENIGYSLANNVGIEVALQQDADYIFLLNNDTIVDADMLAQLVTVAESEPDIGITGPTILYFDESDLIWCAGAGINWRDGGITRLFVNQPMSSVANTNYHDVDFLSSCAVCIKRRVLEEIGLLDGRYFIYYDETDWFARATAAGWRSVFVPQAKMWHRVSATMGTTSPATDYYMNRNVLLFLAKNLRGLPRLSAIMRAAGRNLLTIAAYTIKSHNRQRIPNRNARLLALRDAALRRWGRMGQDVSAVCYRK